MKKLIEFVRVEACAQWLLIMLVCNTIATTAGIYGVWFCEAKADNIGGAAVLAEAMVSWFVIVPLFFMETHEAWQKFIKSINTAA